MSATTIGRVWAYPTHHVNSDALPILSLFTWEDKLRDSEAMGKVIETGGSGMIIGGILCLLLLLKLPILLAPLSFSPLHG